MEKRKMYIDVKAEVWLRTEVETELTDEEIKVEIKECGLVNHIDVGTQLCDWYLQVHIDKISGQEPEILHNPEPPYKNVWVGEIPK